MSAPAERMWPTHLQRWLKEIAAGYALEQMLTREDLPLSADQVLGIRSLLRSLGLFRRGTWQADALLALPVATLQQVARLNRPLFSPLSELAEAQLTTLQVNSDGMSLLLRAKMIANRLQSGTHTPSQMIHLMKSEVNLALVQDSELVVLLQRFMDISSEAHAPIQQVIYSLGQLSSVIGQHWRWRIVENSILHRLFIWPMAVFDGTDINARTGGTTLPLHIAPSTSRLAREDGPKVLFTANGQPVNPSPELESSANRALRDAIRVWQNEFSNWAPDLQRRVAGARPTIELGYAQQVRALAGYSGPLPLGGRSIELYLALAFIGHFLGDPSLRTIAATGVLGAIDRFHDWDTLVDAIEGWEAKLARASLSRDFDMMLFPVPGESEKLINQQVPSNISVRLVSGLEEAARLAFPDSFTKHRFIRCPDLEAAFRNFDPLYNADAVEVERVKSAIEASSDPVLELPGVTARSAANALFRMNRDAGAMAREAGRHLPEADRPAPSGFLQSFAFIRVVDYEQNERFWQVVWELLTGSVRLDTSNPIRHAQQREGLRKRSATGWREFASTLEPDRPAQLISALFNRTSALGPARSRVPDRLVIVGSDRLKTENALCPAGPFARLRLDAMLPALRSGLSPRTRALAERFGRSRMILIPEDEPHQRDLVRVGELPFELREPLLSLSVLTNGFSLDVVKSVLDLDDWDCRVLLKALMRHEHNGVPLISASSDEHREFIANFDIDAGKEPPERLARRHYRAAQALAGFSANGAATRSSDYHRVFKPANVHDAEYHLSEAMRQTREGRSSGLVNDITRMQKRVSRLAEPFSWSAVRYTASRLGDSGIDEALAAAALDHLAYWHEPAHPIELMHLVRLLWNHYRRVKRSTDVRRDTMLRQAVANLNYVVERALREVDLLDRAFAGVSERDACKFVIGSTLFCLLLDERPMKARIEYLGKSDIDNPLRSITLRGALDMADANANAAREIVDRGWYTYRGDWVTLHAEASRHYLAGIANSNIAEVHARSVDLVSLVKYLGSCRLAGLPIDAVAEEAVKQLSRQQIVFVCTNGDAPRGLVDELPRRRWHAGRLKILDMLCQHFELEGDRLGGRRALDSYRQGALMFLRFEGLLIEDFRPDHARCLLKYLGLAAWSRAECDPAIVRLVAAVSSDWRALFIGPRWPSTERMLIAGRRELLRSWKAMPSDRGFPDRADSAI